MQKILAALILALVFASACRKNNVEGNKPPVIIDPDSLYSVTTLMDVEGAVHGLAIADDGTIYYSVNNQIYKIKDSVKSLVAGGEEAGYVDGPGLSARFNNAMGLELDDSNNLYVIDQLNERIRKIDQSGNVSTMIFSFTDSIYYPNEQVTHVTHDTTTRARLIYDLNIKGNHLYVSGGLIDGIGLVACRLDSVNYIYRRFSPIGGGATRGLEITPDEKLLYSCNIYGINTYNLITEEMIKSSSHYDRAFPNFVLGEGDSVVYKPRIDRCIIERMSLATETDSLIAGQPTTDANYPNPSIDGVGTNASFNHLLYVRKKDNFLYIAEANYLDQNGGKIRKMRVP